MVQGPGEEQWGGRAELTGLSPGTSYQVRVSGRNAEGHGQFSSPVTYSTPERGALKAPSVLVANCAGRAVSRMAALLLLLLLLQ